MQTFPEELFVCKCAAQAASTGASGGKAASGTAGPEAKGIPQLQLSHTSVAHPLPLKKRELPPSYEWGGPQ